MGRNVITWYLNYTGNYKIIEKKYSLLSGGPSSLKVYLEFSTMFWRKCLQYFFPKLRRRSITRVFRATEEGLHFLGITELLAISAGDAHVVLLVHSCPQSQPVCLASADQGQPKGLAGLSRQTYLVIGEGHGNGFSGFWLITWSRGLQGELEGFRRRSGAHFSCKFWAVGDWGH